MNLIFLHFRKFKTLFRLLFLKTMYIPEVNCYFLNGYLKRTFKLEHFNPINSIQSFRLFKEANAQTYSS